ncbi:calcium-transporting ATPase, partial [Trichonephila clavata]
SGDGHFQQLLSHWTNGCGAYFFGAGVLVWGQCITTIPTKKIPKTFTWGSGNPEDLDAGGSLVEDTSRGSISQEVKRTGQILWIRGLTRLQTQVIGGELQDRLIPVPYSKAATDEAIRVVSAFRSGMDSRKNSTADSSGALGRSASKRVPLLHPNATASTSADVIKDATTGNDKKNSAHNETPV